MINGSCWLGAAAGALLALLVLNPAYFRPNLGWRLGFALGPLLGTAILFMRRFNPESPRWQLMHGQVAAAEATVAEF